MPATGWQTGSQRLRRSERLLKRADFQRLARYAKKVQTRYFIARFDESTAACNRLGISTSRKVGSAVTRNRIKRLAREYFRQNRNKLGNHQDVHIIAKKEAGIPPNRDVVLSLARLFNKIGARQDD